MKKALLGAALAGITLFSAGCLGPNRAFNGVHEWNQNVSDQDWVNEAVFLACTILPVYGLAYWLDIIILNTVEYWTGDSPMGE